MDLAKAEIYLTLAALVRRFDLEVFQTDRALDVDMQHEFFVGSFYLWQLADGSHVSCNEIAALFQARQQGYSSAGEGLLLLIVKELTRFLLTNPIYTIPAPGAALNILIESESGCNLYLV